jgi:hypothetical protein
MALRWTLQWVTNNGSRKRRCWRFLVFVPSTSQNGGYAEQPHITKAHLDQFIGTNREVPGPNWQKRSGILP